MASPSKLSGGEASWLSSGPTGATPTGAGAGAGAGVAGAPTSGTSAGVALAPSDAGRGFGASPGAVSDLSNEAAAGHGFGSTSSIGGTSPYSPVIPASSSTASGNILVSALHPTSPPSNRVVGGFDSAATTPNMASSVSNGADDDMLPEANTPAASSSIGTFSQLTAVNSSMNEEVIPTTFDEATLRALCDIDCGMPLLYDRIKQSMTSSNQAATFFKKRAVIEEEYARNLAKLARSSAETYATTEGKAGTFVNSWHSIMRTHEALGESRLRFAGKLQEMSEELSTLAKEVDKNRKYARDTGLRLERNLQDAEQGVEKSRSRFDAAAEDLERLLLLKSGESTKGGELQQQSSGPGGKRTLGKAIGKSGLLFKNKNPQQILKQEEEIRSRTSVASDAFRKEVLTTQGMRQEYFNLQLPRILRSLKESSEEIDNGLQYHLARYAFLYESTLLADGTTIMPISADGSVGLKAAAEAIDNRSDFKTFMQNYQVAHARDYKGPRREGPYEEGFVPTLPTASTTGAANAKNNSLSAPRRPIFGVGLADQMARDNVEVPPILEKCAEAIENLGLQNMGIYRLSGTSSKVQRLKSKFDTDWSTVDLFNDEAINDINIVAACLKLWFRELPEPLMTWELYQGFIDAASEFRLSMEAEILH
ncbi:hypothetical protein L7F22_062318 [Adiantum nelumboides]|nr:hypothetical protein [Adiantum nelumboides]